MKIELEIGMQTNLNKYIGGKTMFDFLIGLGAIEVLILE